MLFIVILSNDFFHILVFTSQHNILSYHILLAFKNQSIWGKKVKKQNASHLICLQNQPHMVNYVDTQLNDLMTLKRMG